MALRVPTLKEEVGGDGSYWNGPNHQYPTPMDFSAALAGGVRFFTWRVGVGGNATSSVSGLKNGMDITFPQNWDNMGQAKMPRNGYWAFTPWEDPKVQAQKLVDATEGAGELPDELDVQVHGNLSKSVLAKLWEAHVWEYIRLTNRNPIIYTRGFWYDNHIGEVGFEKDLDLNVAHYGTNNPFIPEAWARHNKRHTFHQDSDTHKFPGATDPTMDRVWFNGTTAEWLAYLGQTPPPLEQPLGKAKVLTRGLNVRSLPLVSSSTLAGSLNRDSILYYFERRVIGADTWVRIGVNRWCAAIYSGQRYMDLF